MRPIIIILSAILFFPSPVFAVANQQTSFDERLYDAKISAVRAEIDAMKEAVKISQATMELRLAGLNELRSEVTRDRDQFVRKDVFDSKVKEYDEAVRRLADLEARLIAWASALVVVFAIVNVGVHLWGLKSRKRYPEDWRSE